MIRNLMFAARVIFALRLVTVGFRMAFLEVKFYYVPALHDRISPVPLWSCHLLSRLLLHPFSPCFTRDIE